MPVNPKAMELIDTLIDSTNQGRLEWSKLPYEETYRVPLDREAVRIEKLEDYYVLSIFNEEGDQLEAVASRQGGEDYPRFEKLFELARQSSLKLDNVIDGLIKKIKARGA